MSEHTLPDELSQWPRDPYELLGVPTDVNERDLKRAYARLIRQYKPEHAPAEFRRIREAYEQIQRSLTMGRPIVEPRGLFADVPQREPQPTTVPHEEPPPAPTTTDRVDDLWIMVCAGDVAEAYAGMLQLVDQGAGEPLLFAQLYWLRTLSPDLDLARAPLAWLWLGLERCPADGTLLTLLLEEARAQPDLLLLDAARHLFQTPNLPWLTRYLTARWQILLMNHAWAAIARDLELLRSCPLRDQALQWLSLLVPVLDWVGWETTDAARLLCTEVSAEVRELQSFGLRAHEPFERIDQGLALMHDCNSIPADVPLVRDLLRDVWRFPEAEGRQALEEFFVRVDQDPLVWVRAFARLGDHAPTTLCYLDAFVQNYIAVANLNLGTEAAPAQLWKFAQRAVEETPLGTHPREEAIRFCLAHHVLPNMIVISFFEGCPQERQIPVWLGSYMDNPALELVVLIRRAFHALG